MRLLLTTPAVFFFYILPFSSTKCTGRVEIPPLVPDVLMKRSSQLTFKKSQCYYFCYKSLCINRIEESRVAEASLYIGCQRPQLCLLKSMKSYNKEPIHEIRTVPCYEVFNPHITLSMLPVVLHLWSYSSPDFFIYFTHE